LFKQRFSKANPMGEEDVRTLMTPLMNGLQLVHDDEVYHRDIKPDNIMFRANGTPVLIDFGAARQIVGMKSRSITTIVTPGYAPIEQYSKKGKIGPWTDIYSLAAVAYACLTGEAPEDATDRVVDDEMKLLANSPSASALLQAIDKALAVKSSNRPQDLSDWYAMWGEDTPIVEDYSQLDDMIDMAGADGVITPDELTFLLNKSEQLMLNKKAAHTYIKQEVKRQGWRFQSSDSINHVKADGIKVSQQDVLDIPQNAEVNVSDSRENIENKEKSPTSSNAPLKFKDTIDKKTTRSTVSEDNIVQSLSELENSKQPASKTVKTKKRRGGDYNKKPTYQGNSVSSPFVEKESDSGSDLMRLIIFIFVIGGVTVLTFAAAFGGF
jgi:serine/threonine protein kinase